MRKIDGVRFGFAGLLLGLVALVLWQSIHLGTWLSGWDNLQTELNIGLNLQRSLSAVWQAYQGVGLLAGMGHAADLVRMLFQAGLEIFIPMNYLRLAMNLMCVISGVWGFWRLGAYWLRDNENRFISTWVGAVFYLFNLGTVQNFWVPFEPFSIAYAVIPWLFLAVSTYLDRPSKLNLSLVLLVGLLISPTGYLQTTFLTIFMAIMVFVFLYRSNSIKFVDRIKPLMAILVVNAFWLLPVIWFSLTSSLVTVKAAINQVATPEVLFSNQAFSGFSDILLMKGYWLSWHDSPSPGFQEPLMNVWVDFLRLPLVGVGQWLLLMLFGICIVLLFKSKHKSKFGLLGIFLVYVLMLRGGLWPFGWMMDFIQSIVPLFSQIFRSPFTKLVTVGILVQASVVTLGFSELLSLSGRIKKNVRFNRLFGFMIGVMFVSLCWPLVTNGLFYKRMNVAIPIEYHELFDYLKKEPTDNRIVNLPLSSMYGWVINSWGYRGSGFLWYGIGQPILDRAFDVWSPHNETFYNELSTIFYLCPENPDEAQLGWCADNVGQVFNKYQVSLALLDESAIVPGRNQEIIRLELWKKVLAKLDPEVDFTSGFLSVYGVGSFGDVVWVPEKYQKIEVDTAYGRFDPYYRDDKVYISSLGGQNSYPFSDLSKESLTGVVEYGEDGLIAIKGRMAESGKVIFPEFADGDIWRGRMRATLSGEDLKIELLPLGQLVVGEQRLPLWLDQRLEVIKLGEAIDSVVVQVGDQVKRIERDKPSEIRDILMTVGEGLMVRVFEGEGREILISTPSARLGQLLANRLIQVDSDQVICLGHEQEHYRCLNQRNTLVTPRTGVYWFDAMEEVKQLPTITIYQPIVEYELSGEMWQKVKMEFEIGAGEIVWETVISPIETRSRNLETGNENCDVLKRGSAEKSIIDNVAMYEAKDYGGYCDSWWVSPIKEQGVLQLEGENLAGRGMKLNLFSTKENRTLLEKLLPSGGKFNQSYGLLTGLQQGSTVNVETKSFGWIKGKNRLDAVRFYPVPLTWLQRITFGEETVIDTRLSIGEVKKWGTGIYKINVSGSGLLVMNQGFDTGWISPQSTHVKVNGWSNGFLVDGEGRKTVWIVFWPQYLEWLGFGFLAALVARLWFDKNQAS